VALVGLGLANLWRPRMVRIVAQAFRQQQAES
jgi:hypothetical protein